MRLEGPVYGAFQHRRWKAPLRSSLRVPLAFLMEALPELFERDIILLGFAVWNVHVIDHRVEMFLLSARCAGSAQNTEEH